MSEPRTFLDGRIVLHAGDSREVLRTLADNSVDSVCCDPPYSLTPIVKRFGKPGAAPAKGNNAYMRASKGFMNCTWDTGETAFDHTFWAEVLRVLKPGGYIFAFSSSRTYHRMACAIEDAGFVMHPMVGYIFGNGFPKATNLSKQIDRAAGAKREVVGAGQYATRWRRTDNKVYGQATPSGDEIVTAPATDAAKQWDGWFYGAQATKPALEPIFCGQKPFERGLNGAQNVLKWGVGAINVDGCRVATGGEDLGDPTRFNGQDKKAHEGWMRPRKNDDMAMGIKQAAAFERQKTLGRWPANVIISPCPEVLAGFPETKSGSIASHHVRTTSKTKNTYGERAAPSEETYGDSGSAARFFTQAEFTELDQPWMYTAKAGNDSRLGSRHPTIKPLALIQWLCRLITPPGGTVLDCFAGTGTTGEAAYREGFSAILIERELEYIKDIEKRISLISSSYNERRRETIKKKNQVAPHESLPLFGGGS